MHKWFSHRLTELINLAQYCQLPMLTAHLILTRNAADHIFDETKEPISALEQILPLMLSQAEKDGQNEVEAHLQSALKALHASTETASNIVTVDFGNTSGVIRQSGP